MLHKNVSVVINLLIMEITDLVSKGFSKLSIDRQFSTIPIRSYLGVCNYMTTDNVMTRNRYSQKNARLANTYLFG